jgi:DNA polymerase-3 subunit alpha (Gram-positive type)
MSRFVALDFETSGLDPKVNAPVSIGVALMDGGEVIDSLELFIAPPTRDGRITRVYDVCALEVSGTSWKQIKTAPTALSVCKDLRKWAEKHDARHLQVVAFNAPFDLAFYSELLFMAGNWNQHLRQFEAFIAPFLGPWQCARMLAMDALRLDKYSLDSVSEHYGFSRTGETHGSLEDAILAGKVYAQLAPRPLKEGV